MPERRFPPPWTVEELEACFVVRDHNGQKLAYAYFKEEPGRRSTAKLQRVTRRGESQRISLSCRNSRERGELRGRSVPQYFFTIRGPDRVEDDPDGTYLPDVAAALSYAESTIRELRKKNRYNDAALMMVVKDQARQTVLSLPFLPGC